MEQPLVSVVIPFYSELNWLIEAITSVRNQTYPNIEVLVINDGSMEDISGFSEIYGENIKVINKENGGPASARNVGIDYSRGKYIAFLDSDDLWLPDKLSKQIEVMELNQYVWSQHSYEMFWDDKNKKKIINTRIFSGNVYRECFISFKVQTSCVVVLRKILLENNIRFPLEKRYGQDTDFYKQIAKKYPIGYVNGIYSRFRIRGTNAGFRAKVQLNDKATTWKEIKDDQSILGILPWPVKFAYMASSVFNNFINKLDKIYIRNEVSIEMISKLMYIFPYVIYKIYSKKE